MRSSQNLLFISLALSVLFWFLNKIAVAFSLFWLLWWYDIPMHFLGGVVLGAFILWLIGRIGGPFVKPSGVSAIVLSLSLTLFIGVVWEVFEYKFDIAYNSVLGYWADTAKDLLVDLAGAALVLWWYLKRTVPGGTS